jgi:hypothetical protein
MDDMVHLVDLVEAEQFAGGSLELDHRMKMVFTVRRVREN